MFGWGDEKETNIFLSSLSFDVRTHDGTSLSDLSSKLVKLNEMKQIKQDEGVI